MNHAAQLLVSVRCASEARAAMQGGADVIDVKEPERGPLGRADAGVVKEILDVVGDDRQISAAMGELDQCLALDSAVRTSYTKLRLDYVKVGLAGADADWRSSLARVRDELAPLPLVVAAYADAHRAGAPPVKMLLKWASEHRCAGLLIDTAVKDGKDLFHWMDQKQLTQIIAAAHTAGMIIALAGSLAAATVQRAAALGPDILAVRGCACKHGQRTSPVDQARVRSIRLSLSTRNAPADQDAG